jgi:hypothetical protein
MAPGFDASNALERSSQRGGVAGRRLANPFSPVCDQRLHFSAQHKARQRCCSPSRGVARNTNTYFGREVDLCRKAEKQFTKCESENSQKPSVVNSSSCRPSGPNRTAEAGHSLGKPTADDKSLVLFLAEHIAVPIDLLASFRGCSLSEMRRWVTRAKNACGSGQRYIRLRSMNGFCSAPTARSWSGSGPLVMNVQAQSNSTIDARSSKRACCCERSSPARVGFPNGSFVFLAPGNGYRMGYSSLTASGG